MIYFVDSNFLPVPGGDAYATINDINKIMTNVPAWEINNYVQKTGLIIAATKKIDVGLRYIGSKLDPVQPLQFPRKINQIATWVDPVDNILSPQGQAEILIYCVALQVEYDLFRAPIGQVNYSRGDISETPIQTTLARGVKIRLMPYRQ